MVGPPMNVSPLPVGGSALLGFYGVDDGDFDVPSNVTTMTLVRTGTDGSNVQLYEGVPVAYWVDVGDGPSTSSQPLNSEIGYTWTATDANGTTTLGPFFLGNAIVTTPEPLTAILIRLLQAACDNSLKPNGMTVQKAEVTTRMPAGGWGATPFIVVNLALFQQADVALGQDVFAPNNENLWTLPGWSKRVWQIDILSQNADERDFYRDMLLIAFRTLKATFFSQISQNINHTFQATSGTTGDEWMGQAPGFYWSQLMLTLEGEFAVTVMTGFNRIEQIDLAAISNGATTDVTVPLTGAP